MVEPASRGKQRGLALLFLLILIGMAGAFFLINTMNKSNAALSLARDQKTQAALDLAKQALLAYAATVGAEKSMDASATNPGVPGYLPCPDQGSVFLPEGSQAGTCGSALVSTIGKLPWYTLGLEPLRDASGECLLYAVSGTYKNNPNGVTTNSATSNMMNWDTPGWFDVLAPGGSTYLTGGSTSPSSRAVAVIFAPGPPLSGQSRPSISGTNCGGDYNAAHYLDLETASGINNSTVPTVANAITQFIAGQASDTFNDRLIYITRDELWSAIKKRPDFQDRLTGPVNGLTRKAAQCLAQFGMNNFNYASGDRRLPWASPLSLSTTALSAYMIDTNYNDVASDVVGRLSYVVNNSRSSSGSTQPKNNLSSPYYLFYPFNVPPPILTGCYSTLSNADLAWYENWKDHLFYGVASAHYPTASPNQPVASCNDTRCLQANSIGTGGPYYAAVVIFAGERLAGQSRETASNRGNMTNYLEGRNQSNISTGNGHDNYETGAATSSFNDVLYCIRPDLTVVSCP